MFAAELNGKIPTELQNYEDILTSSVIGVFQYLSSPAYLQTLLQSCVNVNGIPIHFKKVIKETHFAFWPKLDCSEPDVLIKLIDEDGLQSLVCIEAKFWSEKSSKEEESIEFEDRTIAQRDQLAREMEDIHKDTCLRYMNLNKNRLENVFLIYLTNHTYLPSEEMRESLKYVTEPKITTHQLFWLPWREIHNDLNKLTMFYTPQDKKLLRDLQKLMEKKSLQSFTGFSQKVKNVSVFINKYHSEIDYHQTYIKNIEPLNWGYGGRAYGK